jgi:hypothetical protein
MRCTNVDLRVIGEQIVLCSTGNRAVASSLKRFSFANGVM